VNTDPPFWPIPPPGVERLKHPSNIEVSIRYWSAVEETAHARGDCDLARTAAGLRLSYEDVLLKLVVRAGHRRGYRTAAVNGVPSSRTLPE
jgi:hypothetical protein